MIKTDIAQPIGGYFSLELPCKEEYHPLALKLNTGRNCLEYILRCRRYRKVYVPRYICSSALEPFAKLGVEYQTYGINLQLELGEDITLGDSEALMYVNYFGLKDNYVAQLAKKYGHRLIVDNTQAFFNRPVAGIDTFYSCRKFFGVPDGAYLYTTAKADFDIEQDVSFERMDFLCKRIDISPEEAYRDFRAESDSLAGQPIKIMSKLTERLMQAIDYEAAARQRCANYDLLDQSLQDSNLLRLERTAGSVPMVYPYLCEHDGLRQFLIAHKVFVAQYWPDVLEWTAKDEWEHQVTRRMLPLPIDQRYGKADMERILALLKAN